MNFIGIGVDGSLIDVLALLVGVGADRRRVGVGNS